MEPFRLPKNLALGVATSALQVEGGDKNNSWYRWAEQGKIKDDTHCIVADDHWNRVQEDVEMMANLSVKTYRMGIEWSRIEPRPGEFDRAALEHYRREIEALHQAGIWPMVTMHHFSNPLWFEDKGGWLNSAAVEVFSRYAGYLAKHLGDLVSHWITINEPNVYLVFGYMKGIWPPGGKGDFRSYFRGARQMIKAHIAAYRKIHEMQSRANSAMVGTANHLRLFDPQKNTVLNKWVCRGYDRIFQEMFVTGMTEGRWLSPFGFDYFLEKGSFVDFFGINYYSRDMVITSNPAMFGKLTVRDSAPVNDLGWEIYPEGLYRICKKYHKRYALPIYITENGTCDCKDAFRGKFIYDHLLELKRLVDEGVDIRGYYHWSAMDNFEWAEGLTPRFGLIEIDYRTQERKIRKSGEFYREICRNGEISQEMIEKYLGSCWLRPKM